MYQSTLAGQFVSVDAQLAHLLGYDSPSELQDSITDIARQFYVEPDNRNRLLQLIHQDGMVNHLESRVRRKDGSYLWIAEYAEPIRNTAGDLTGLRGALVDISTLRKQAGTPGSYHSFFVNSVIGMYRSTPDGRLIETNPALARLLGFASPTELLSKISDLAALYDDPADRNAVLDAVGSSPDGTNIEFHLRRHCDGALIRVQENSRAVRDAAGRILFFEGTLQDVSDRHDAEIALRRSETRYRALVDNSQVGVFISRAGHYDYVNDAFAAMLGMTRGDLEGRHFRDIYAPESITDAVCRFEARQCGQGSPEHFETVLLHADGQTRVPVIVTIQSLHQDGEQLATGTVSDVREQKRVERELRHNATHDALTNLPNRTLFLERLEKTIADSRGNNRHDYAVCFLDLDGFKVINDSLGHAAGDTLLQQIGERISECLDPWDIVSRHGGDEFTLLLANTASAEEAVQTAQRLREALHQPFTIEGKEVYTRASIGIAMGGENITAAADLLRDADTAMYSAKYGSHNRIAVFDVRMHETAHWRLRLETDLRVGLERNQFELHYQPVRQLGSDHIAGFEALLRWRHPELGMLSPGDFLAVAEETGMILPIGWWVLEQATRQLAIWQGTLPHRKCFISVNIAHRQFHHPQLESHLARVLRDAEIDPASLHLELTESIFMESPDVAIARLEKLKALGVKLYLDDFGTGYSSFSYLNRYPLDTVKIDRTFIAEMSASDRGRKVVSGIVQLANALGVDIVAEGIETEKQRQQLRRLGIRLGQGHLLGSPDTAREATEALLQPQRRRWLPWLPRVIRQAPTR